MKTEASWTSSTHERIVAAIRAAEERSRGEVRVHVTDQPTSHVEDAAARPSSRSWT